MKTTHHKKCLLPIYCIVLETLNSSNSIIQKKISQVQLQKVIAVKSWNCFTPFSLSFFFFFILISYFLFLISWGPTQNSLKRIKMKIVKKRTKMIKNLKPVFRCHASQGYCSIYLASPCLNRSLTQLQNPTF